MNEICICCTSSNNELIALKTCKHSKMLKPWVKLKILRTSNICYLCHNMLKKIEAFKAQVEDSQKLLFNKTSTIKLKKIYNLKSIVIETTNDTKFNSDPLELEYQITEHKILNSIETNDVTIYTHIPKKEINDFTSEINDLKIERDTSESETTNNEVDDFNDSEINDLEIKRETSESETTNKEVDGFNDSEINDLKKERETSESEATNKEVDEINDIEIDDLKIENKTIELNNEKSNNEINESNNSELKKKVDVSESEIPLKEVRKTKKKRYIDQYEGKVNILKLSMEDVKREREEMAKVEKYMKFPYKCKFCIVGFDHEATYNSHMEKRHSKTKNNYQCNICMCVLNKEATFNDHRKRHFIRYQCVECGKKYNHDHSAMEHYDEVHSPEGTSPLRTYVCRHCGFTTSRGRMYRYHLDKHKKKHECELCGNTFITTNSLRRHLFTVHGQSTRVYSCKLCNKTYRADSGLGAHMRSVHSNGAQAYCAQCDTHYVTAHALKVHQATHSNHIQESDKRYICDDCGAKFVRKHSLEVHINWEHLKISSHRCSKCSKVFKAKKCLLRHIKFVHEKHRPPRDKICHVCGRGFTTQPILQSHIRTHTGERPLQCKHCKANFGHSGALYTHIKLKHNGLKK